MEIQQQNSDLNREIKTYNDIKKNVSSVNDMRQLERTKDKILDIIFNWKHELLQDDLDEILSSTSVNAFINI